jgi:energy-converting hydrogenase Eha subunit A
VLVEAVAVLLPQPLVLLGAELVAINLFGLRLPLTIIRNYYDKHITISHSGGFPTVLIATVIAAYLLGAAGGAVLMRGLEWGLYAVALSCLVKIVRSVLTAWMLIFSLSHAQKAKREG